VAKAGDSGQVAQSFAQPPNRVGRRTVGVHYRLQFRIGVTESFLIKDYNFFKRARLFTNSGCQIGRGGRLFGERRRQISAEYIEYLSRINGSDDRVAPPRQGIIHAARTIQFCEGGAYLGFGVGGLLCGVGGLGRWRIVVWHWAKPSNKTDCYTNKRNRQSDEHGPA
jgi:hypothetical protein